MLPLRRSDSPRSLGFLERERSRGHEQDAHLPSAEAAAQQRKCAGGVVVDAHKVQGRRLRRVGHGVAFLVAGVPRLRWIHHAAALPTRAPNFLLRPGSPHLRDLQSDPQELGAGAAAADVRSVGDVRHVRVAVGALAVHALLRQLPHGAGHHHLHLLRRLREGALHRAAVGALPACHVLARLLGLPLRRAGPRRRRAGPAAGAALVLVRAPLLPPPVPPLRALPRLSLPPHQGQPTHPRRHRLRVPRLQPRAHARRAALPHLAVAACCRCLASPASALPSLPPCQVGLS